MNVSEIIERILVSTITTIILEVLPVVWFWISDGGLLEGIGGLKKEQIENLFDGELKKPERFDEQVKKEVTNQLSGVHLPVGAVVAFAQKDCP